MHGDWTNIVDGATLHLLYIGGGRVWSISFQCIKGIQGCIRDMRVFNQKEREQIILIDILLAVIFNLGYYMNFHIYLTNKIKKVALCKYKPKRYAYNICFEHRNIMNVT